jgi:hypothetical protein
VSLEEVSRTPFGVLGLFLQEPLRRVTNTYVRCKHDVQLVSGGRTYRALLAGHLMIVSATERRGGERRIVKAICMARSTDC